MIPARFLAVLIITAIASCTAATTALAPDAAPVPVPSTPQPDAVLPSTPLAATVASASADVADVPEPGSLVGLGALACLLICGRFARVGALHQRGLE